MQFVRFPSLQSTAGLHHAITTRDGGLSASPFDSLNLGFHVGDDAQSVRDNRIRVAKALGYDCGTLTSAQQTHGTNVCIINREIAGCGALDWQSALPDADALIVAESNLPVSVLVADCAPILIVDATRQVLAVVHAGWRGALGGIAGKTIQKMRAEFETNAANAQVGIGPCLCVECLEVGEEVAAQIENPFVRRDFARPHLDLRAMICDDLKRQGIAPDRIEIIDECPRCNRAKYFSHRGDGGQTGRFGLIAWWE